MLLCSSSKGLLDVCDTMIGMHNLIYLRNSTYTLFLDHPVTQTGVWDGLIVTSRGKETTLQVRS